MELAIATGIPPTAWADEGERAIVTALELLKRPAGGGDSDGRQLSG